MCIRGVLFDLDGTLVDTTDLIIQTFKVTLRDKLNINATDAEITRYFGLPLTECLSFFNQDRAAELTDYYRAYNLLHHDALIKPFPTVAETLFHLRKNNIKIAVVTSKTKSMALRGLRIFDLEKYIDIIIGCEECSKHKPEPEPMLLGAQGLKLLPAECLCVGDSPYDLLSGRAAGCTTVAVKWTKMDPSFFISCIKPDYTISKLSDLLNVIEDINRKRC